MFKHVPNILTMLRFVLIPFIFIAIIRNDPECDGPKQYPGLMKK